MPIRTRDLDDTNFGELDVNKDNNVINYSSTPDKFELKSSGGILEVAGEDTLPDEFVTVCNTQINPNEITKFDAGTF